MYFWYKIVMTKKKYRLVLFFLITFFCVFDGMRSNIVLNQIISPLKELSIVLCFIECNYSAPYGHK